MTVRDLTEAERKECEEESKALDELEYVQAEPDEKIAPNDEMFCTAAGAANIRPSGKSKNFLRQLFREADRA